MKRWLLIFFVIGFAITYTLWIFLNRNNNELNVLTVSTQWQNVFEELDDKWVNGVSLKDPQVQLNCRDLKNLDEVSVSIRSCRRYLFRCYFKNRLNVIKNRDIFSNYKVSFPNIDSSKWSLPVDIEMNKKLKRIFIKDDCLMKDIPIQHYNHGKFIQSKNIWHPGDVKYWVDKFLVRNIDIRDWRNSIKVSAEDLFRPAFNLTIKEMELFCRYRGGVVLNSNLADAVTYYRPNVSDKEKINKNLSPYPFSVRRSKTSHYRATKDVNYEVTEDDCLSVKTSDCLIKGFETNPVEGLGWSGVGELLGGPFEYVKNKIHPRRNLILSSYYYPLSSFVHRAGVRGFWDGEGHKYTNFNFVMSSPIMIDHYNVGFRCMGVR